MTVFNCRLTANPAAPGKTSNAGNNKFPANRIPTIMTNPTSSINV